MTMRTEALIWIAVGILFCIGFILAIMENVNTICFSICLGSMIQTVFYWIIVAIKGRSPSWT